MQRFTICAALLATLAACGSDDVVAPSRESPSEAKADVLPPPPPADSTPTAPGDGGIMIGGAG
ncbi:MAG TPA: hypothetical protein VEY93_09345 [Longimicrobium sp.]|nr:hypothetical protein [Longimicrobium sp.]